MSHQEFDELTSLYALGALDGDDLARFTAHLAGCESCRAAVAEHERVGTGLALGLPPERPSSGAREALLARVRPPQARTAASFRGWHMVAAGLAIVVTGMSYLYFRARSEEYSRRMEVAAIRGKLEALKEELASQRKELERLAKMDALIRDIKSEMLALQGTGDHAGATGRIVWRGNEIAWWSTLPAIEGKVYELWALVDGKPAPAGIYDAKGNLLQAYWKVPEGAKIQGFAVSLEDKAVDSPTKVVMVPAQ